MQRSRYLYRNNSASGRGALPNKPTLRLTNPYTKGTHVMDAQRRLVAAGYPLKIDGVFGPETQFKVKQFQKTEGLAVDGVIGPRTWAALYAGEIASGGGSSTGNDVKVPVMAGGSGVSIQDLIRQYGLVAAGVFGSVFAIRRISNNNQAKKRK